ncbi:hypothetical protein Slu03_07050 [Sediminihabitans luteus]|nr:hypothetical protein Slu03_07050 [Sediminihabitans luteus]
MQDDGRAPGGRVPDEDGAGGRGFGRDADGRDAPAGDAGGWPEDPTDESRPRRGPAARGNAFALFAEVLLVGAFVLVTSIPVITVPASLAAGSAHLRRHVAGVDDGIGTLFADWWRALRDLWALGVVTLLVGAFLALDLVALGSSALPGGGYVRLLVLLAAGVCVVVLLRATAAWSAGRWNDGSGRTSSGRTSSGRDRSVSDGSGGDIAGSDIAGGDASAADVGWSGGPLDAPGEGPVRRAGRALRVGVTAASDDRSGSVLLLAAVGACAVLVWMLVPLAVVVGGLLCMATLAVASRSRAAGV